MRRRKHKRTHRLPPRRALEKTEQCSKEETKSFFVSVGGSVWRWACQANIRCQIEQFQCIWKTEDLQSCETECGRQFHRSEHILLKSWFSYRISGEIPELDAHLWSSGLQCNLFTSLFSTSLVSYCLLGTLR
ncbi:uncharacterized protein LOC127780768 isoform X6 [Oryza glaberrima]|uniref:uncharacterized protein LOC127780768 isoform X6 n=1 Tax=Oryza glaberrima TaxID=4538 RepID=UPI000E1BB287|nr:uncharacterized protein LOC4342282 isoform X7 [Oryza sativa Japonica Group]XP_052163692.1 uncharacterized protein LOC127780768 isoform X6 [Oryza glaberrima]